MTPNSDTGTDDKSQGNTGGSKGDDALMTGGASQSTSDTKASSIDNDKPSSAGTKIHAFRRTDATVVDFSPLGARLKTLVKFNKNAEGDVVAVVSDSKLVQRLLDIPEAYRIYEVAVEPADEGPTTAQLEEQRMQVQRLAELRIADERAMATRARELLSNNYDTPRSSKVLPQIISLTGQKTITQAEVILATMAKSALSVREWNDLQDDEREALLSREVESMENTAEQEEEFAASELRRLAAETAAREEAERVGREAMKFVLLNGSTRIDLKELDDAQLKAFAKQYNVAVPRGSKGDDIRQVLMDSLVTAPADSNQTKAAGGETE